jgi:purine-binding chemotaxis protein CheW
MKGKNEYLTFRIYNDLFAIPIERVHNIMELSHLTSDHFKNSFIAGSVNFRGVNIPVIDMHMKFDLPHNDFLNSTCVIVVNVDLKIEKLLVGILVDALYEVTETKINITHLTERNPIIKGIFQKSDGSDLKIIDPDEMFSEYEIEVLKNH